jgi:hypothetical protein
MPAPLVVTVVCAVVLATATSALKSNPPREHMTKYLAAAVATCALLVGAGTASADWYLTQGQAERYAAIQAARLYGDALEDGACNNYYSLAHPQIDHNNTHVGKRWHRWVVLWNDDPGYFGTLLIVGTHSTKHQWLYRVEHGRRDARDPSAEP